MEADDIESRIDRIANLYSKLEELVDGLPDMVPHAVREFIKRKILDSKEMEELVRGIKDRRPPRFVLVGRTGVGKSSLVNAMCGKYLAQVSDVAVGTVACDRYSYKFMGKTIFEIVDTRGVGESLREGDRSAEDELKYAVKEFRPDAILFLARGKERGYVDKDAEVVRDLAEVVGKEVPVIVIVTQVDELEPARIKSPRQYDERKLNNIREAAQQVKQVVNKVGLEPLTVLPVSSYVEWKPHPNRNAPETWEGLKIEFDGRYQIEELLDLLESNMDLRAGIYLMLVARIDQVARKVSKRLTIIFAGISSVIAITPIPLSDIYALLVLQIVLITSVAYLAGRDLTSKTAGEMLKALGALGPSGLIFRTIAQQGSKFLNLVFPGFGSAVSAGVAYGGTYSIGMAAIAYFLEGVTGEDLRRIVAEARKERKPPGT